MVVQVLRLPVHSRLLLYQPFRRICPCTQRERSAEKVWTWSRDLSAMSPRRLHRSRPGKSLLLLQRLIEFQQLPLDLMAPWKLPLRQVRGLVLPHGHRPPSHPLILAHPSSLTALRASGAQLARTVSGYLLSPFLPGRSLCCSSIYSLRVSCISYTLAWSGTRRTLGYIQTTLLIHAPHHLSTQAHPFPIHVHIQI